MIFFESISYYQITEDNLQDKIGAFKKIFHKAYNILMQLERVCKAVIGTSFNNDEAKAMISRYNKETLRHWILAKLRTLKNNNGKRKAWEDGNFTPLYDELTELAESNGLFEESKDAIKEFMLNINADGIPPVLHINQEKTSHVAIFLGLLKQHKLIYGRYQKFIQDRGCLIGAGGRPVTSSTLSTSKNFYRYRFEDGDDLNKYQDTPVDSLLLKHFAKSDYLLDKLWASIKIAIRHHYNIKDASLWCDLVEMIEYMGKDIHNPTLICPENLNAAHNHWLLLKQAKMEKERIRRERERIQAEERRYLENVQKAKDNEIMYQQAKSRFFDIDISDDEITIRPLKSVQEFMDEGRLHHHCVFTNSYYSKDNALILHALVNGESVETIEISLDSMEIVQCRGKFNGTTDYHDRILSLNDSKYV